MIYFGDKMTFSKTTIGNYDILFRRRLMFLVAEIREKTTKQWIAAALYLVKGTMSPLGHARANEKKLGKVSPTFPRPVGDFGRPFYLFKYQSSFDSKGSFVLRIVLWWLHKTFLRCFWNCLPLEFLLGGFTLSSCQRPLCWQRPREN